MKKSRTKRGKVRFYMKEEKIPTKICIMPRMIVETNPKTGKNIKPITEAMMKMKLPLVFPIDFGGHTNPIKREKIVEKVKKEALKAIGKIMKKQQLITENSWYLLEKFDRTSSKIKTECYG